MKNKLFIVLLIAAGFANTAVAQIQTTIPPKKVVAPPTVTPNIFKLFSVNINVDSVSHSGGTAKLGYLKITFTSVGKGVVSYKLSQKIQNANGTSATISTSTATLSGTGTDVVFIQKSASERSGNSFFITTTTPNSVTSNTVGF